MKVYWEKKFGGFFDFYVLFVMEGSWCIFFVVIKIVIFSSLFVYLRC